MEMKGAAQRPSLHELTAVPERVANLLLGDAGDAHSELQLGRRLDLRVDATCLVHHLDEAVCGCALGEGATRNAPRADLVPRDALQLEEPLSVDELAPAEPGERAALDDLEMDSRRVVLRVIVAVLRDPGADGFVGAQARDSLAVEEDRVGHQPPAAAYAATPLEASAACAAASRASGTR